MGRDDARAAGAPGRVVCLGEPLLDLVCEQPAGALAAAPSFVPHPGGSLANIAVCAARFGAAAELVGAAGDDEWGRWLRERLAAAGVGVERLALLRGCATSHAFIAVDARGEPSFAFYGEPQRATARTRDALAAALAGRPGVLVLGSDTLVQPGERRLTMDAAAAGREHGWRIVCDPNLRPRRWREQEEMLATVRALVATANVVKCNAAEALALTGAATGQDAALALLDLGPAAAVVTRGADPALLAADALVEVPAVPARVRDATGAGDCIAGVLAAALALGASPSGLAPALRVAMGAAARVVERWGATAGLPAAAEARAALAAAG